MKKIATRKLVLGLLVGLVLAFGVQGIAEAADLPLMKRTGDLQTKSVDEQFEISFTVGIRPNTTAIKNSAGKPIDDGRVTPEGNATSNTTPQWTRIDNSGYPVREINGKDYRLGDSDVRTNLLPPTPDTPAPPSDRDDSETDTYAAYAVYEHISGSQYRAYFSGNIYADSGRNAYSEAGYPLYYYTLGFEYDSKDDDSTDDKTAPAKRGPRIQIRQEDFEDARLAANRYHYNEESIAIALDTDDSTDGVTMTFKLKASGFQRDITALTEVPGSDPDAIPRSVTLVCTPSAVGTYKVKITDATPVTDTPWTTLPDPRASIEFTLHVVDDSSAVTGITVPDDDIFFGGETLRIDDRFTLSGTDAPSTVLIQYTVTSGPGTIFERTSPTNASSSVKNLQTSKESQVYLNMNNGNSVVRITVSGQDPVKKGELITFTYTGEGARTTTTSNQQNQQQNQQNQQQQTTPNRLSISLSGSENTRTVTVNALQAGTTSTSGIFTTLTTNGGALSTTSGATPLTSTWTLPSAAGAYTVTATTTAGYTSDSESVTVTVPGTLTARQDGGTIVVSASPAPSSNLAFTLTTSGGVYAGRGEILPAGTGRAIPILTTGSHILTVTAEGYNSAQVSFTPGTTQQPATTTTTGQQPTTAGSTPTGTASRVQIRSDAFPSGRVNTQLTQPLAVRVLDRNGNGVSNIRVTFRVTSGRGRLSQRGNGSANVVRTNASGDARTPYTPLSATSRVRATATGVSQTVTFTITAEGGAATPTTPSTSTTPQRPATTISPVVHIAAASRPPMVWVANGAIYALVGEKPQRFIAGVTNAQNIAVAGDKVYWTARTSASSGTIHSANTDGTGATQLATRPSVPMGIAVDTTRKKLFWTTRAGTIERSNLDGTGIETVRSNLSGIQDIAIAGNGNPYWTQGNGSVRFVNIAGQTPIWTIASGAAAVGSLTLADGKVYWTARTGATGGTINRANLNGSGKIVLAEIQATPIGVAVDSVRNHVYWTNSGGRLQRRNLSGNGTGTIENVVEGLGSPGDLVLSNSIMAPAAAMPSTTTPTPTASASPYDLNGDGSVDSTDVDVILLAVSAGLTLPKYDVNGDTRVDIKDVMAVNANLDGGVASAPTLLGQQFSGLEIARLQQQIDVLIATGDRSPGAIKMLIYLQQLIALARPEQTQLLANYPNPFNPETWIPYELATDTDVRITIYNAQGVVIRTLHLGQQSAGYYTERERAAYWDGRNALGEQVASGIYFYQLETDEISSLRKMVILK